MLELLLLASLTLIFLGIASFAIGFFAPPKESSYEAAFKVNVDNLDRRTIFDIPELHAVLWPFLQIARRLAPERFRHRILRNLRSSGNPHGFSPEEYITLCILSGLALAFVVFLMQAVFAELNIHPISFSIAFTLGFGICELSLASRATKLLREINRQLPYGLDLIAMTMQAGATFYEAAKTVVNENPEEPFNQELAIVVREIEFGRSRQEALQHFADRIPIESLNTIMAAVLQAEQLGTPLAEVLLLQANLLRMYRTMRAEKTLGEATVKILVPSVLIFMAAILIVFGPVLVRALTGQLLLPF